MLGLSEKESDRRTCAIRPAREYSSVSRAITFPTQCFSAGGVNTTMPWVVQYYAGDVIEDLQRTFLTHGV